MSTDIIDRLNKRIDAVFSGYMEAYWEGEEFAKQFENVLDFKFVITSDMQYRGVVITESLGGPTIYTNTDAGEFQAYWGSDAAVRRSIPWMLLDAIDEYYSELYESMK